MVASFLITKDFTHCAFYIIQMHLLISSIIFLVSPYFRWFRRLVPVCWSSMVLQRCDWLCVSAERQNGHFTEGVVSQDLNHKYQTFEWTLKYRKINWMYISKTFFFFLQFLTLTYLYQNYPTPGKSCYTVRSSPKHHLLLYYQTVLKDKLLKVKYFSW